MKEIMKILAEMTSPEEIEKFFFEILTENERRDISIRWELMKQLYAGVPQRVIATELGISLCRITRGSKILKDENSITSRLMRIKFGDS